MRETDPSAAIASISASGLGRALVRFAMADGEETNSRRLAVANALAATGVGVAIQVLQTPEFLAGEPVADFAARILSGCTFSPDWLCVGQGINALAWRIRTPSELKRLAAAGRRVAEPVAARDVPSSAVAPAVESPVLQTGCANIAAIFEGEEPWDMLALAWREGDGDLACEAKTLAAIAADAATPPPGIAVIADTPVDPGMAAALPGCVREICSSRFLR